MAEICERLVAAGLPLWRVGVFVRTLHPDIYGRNFIWRPGAEVEIGTVDFNILDTPEFTTSPMSIVFAAGTGGPGPRRRSRQRALSDHRGPARRRRHRLHRAAAAVHRRHGQRIELDHEAARRLHRRAIGGAARAGAAAGAGDRDHQLAPHRGDPARHLCRQPRRRADPGRPDPARPYRDDACRDLAVGPARLHRAVGPAAGRDLVDILNRYFDCQVAAIRDAWRRGAEIHGRRAARGVSDRRICRR